MKRAFLILAAIAMVVATPVQQAFAAPHNYIWNDHFETGLNLTRTESSADGNILFSWNGWGWNYLSTDRGATWEKLDDFPIMGWYSGSMSADGSRILVAGDDGLYISTDTGATWTQQTTPYDPSSWRSMAMSDDGMTVAALTNSLVYTSHDGGVTWVEQADSSAAALGSTPYYNDIVVSGDGQKIYAISQFHLSAGVFYSHDSGTTWTAAAGMTNTQLRIASASEDGSHLIAVSGKSTPGYYAWVSNDSGVTWTQTTQLLGHWSNVVFSMTADASTMYATTVDDLTRYVSTDYGTTWSSSTGSGFSLNGTGYASFAADDPLKMVILADAGGMFTSDDGGLTWNMVWMSTERYWASGALASDSNKLFVTDYDGSAYTSDDGGMTWEQKMGNTAGLDDLFFSASSADGQTLAMTQDLGPILISHDRGDSWTQPPSAGSAVWTGIAMSDDGMTMYATDATASGSVRKSTDGGATWAVLATAGNANYNGLSVSADGQTVFVMVDGAVPKLSTDGGASWSDMTSLPNMQWVYSAVSADGSKLVAGTWDDGTVYYSDDSGATWQTNTDIGSAGTNSIGMSADGSVILVGTYSEYFYVSEDGGASFTQITDYGTNFAWRPALVADDGNKLYIFANNGGMKYAAVPSGSGSGDGSGSGSGSTGGGTSNPEVEGGSGPESTLADTGLSVGLLIAVAATMSVTGLLIIARIAHSRWHRYSS